MVRFVHADMTFYELSGVCKRRLNNNGLAYSFPHAIIELTVPPFFLPVCQSLLPALFYQHCRRIDQQIILG